MQNTRTIIILFITVFYWSITFCQMTIKEKDYTMIYNDRNIALTFDSNVQLQAYDALTNQEINIDKEQTQKNIIKIYNILIIGRMKYQMLTS